VVPVLLVANLLVRASPRLAHIPGPTPTDPTAQTPLGPLLGVESVQLAGIVVSTLLGAILTGMLTIAVTQDVLGISLTIGQVWERTRGRIWRLIALAVLTTLLQFLGLLLCIAPGIWLWGIWAVSVPALMVENTTVRGALGRSRALVSGTFWRVWGIRALGALMVMFVGGFILAPFEIVGIVVDSDVFSASTGSSHVPVVFVVLTAIGSAVSATFTAPVRAGIDSLLYVDLRMRKEGLDIALQQAAARAAPVVPPAPRTAF
jgi:hypothetical protein